MNEEAPENVLQIRTSDITKELRQDDRNVELCRHAVCCSVLQCVATCCSVLQSQIRTSDKTKELSWDEMTAMQTCVDTLPEDVSKKAQSLCKRAIYFHTIARYLCQKSPISLHKSPIPLQITPARRHTGSAIPVATPPPPCYRVAASSTLSGLLGLFLKTSPISRRALWQK